MSTANFKSMKNFPLIVACGEYVKVCPECGLSNRRDVCEYCGTSLSDVESVYDECGMDNVVSEMEHTAKVLNSNLRFHEVSVESGYYSGVQFYVHKNHDVESMDNEDTNYEFGMCRSIALRKYKSEVNFICRKLREAKDYMGLMELGIVARFSNGETMYTAITPDMPKRAALKVAVNAA